MSKNLLKGYIKEKIGLLLISYRIETNSKKWKANTPQSFVLCEEHAEEPLLTELTSGERLIYGFFPEDFILNSYKEYIIDIDKKIENDPIAGLLFIEKQLEGKGINIKLLRKEFSYDIINYYAKVVYKILEKSVYNEARKMVRDFKEIVKKENIQIMDDIALRFGEFILKFTKYGRCIMSHYIYDDVIQIPFKGCEKALELEKKKKK